MNSLGTQPLERVSAGNNEPNPYRVLYVTNATNVPMWQVLPEPIMCVEGDEQDYAM
jgi:hypothetical protein